MWYVRRSATFGRLLVAAVLSLLISWMPSQVWADGLANVRTGNDSFKNGAYEDAIDAYSRAILSGELDIDAMAVTFNNRGVVYGELGDFDRAIGDYQESLALKPDDRTTLKNLRVAFSRRANAYDNLGESQRAVADYTQALEIDHNHVPTLLQRAQALQLTDNLAAAKVDLDLAASLEPANQQIRTALDQVEAALGSSTALAADAKVADSDPSKKLPQILQSATATSGDQAEQDHSASAAQAAEIIEQSKSKDAVVFAQGDIEKAELFQAIQSVNFRNGPGNDFDRLGAIDAGAQVQVVGIDQGWMQVILANGQRGYIYKKWLKPIAPE